MSAAVDYRERHKALRAKFFPVGRSYFEPPAKAKKLPTRWRFIYPEPIGPVVRDILDIRTVDDSGREVVHPAIPPAFRQSQMVREIITNVCTRYGVTELELFSDCRKPAGVHARQEAYYHIRNKTTWSLPKIGMYFGGKDHTTVIHGIKMHMKRNGAGA